jgi:hypothetical protein
MGKNRATIRMGKALALRWTPYRSKSRGSRGKV